MPDTTHITVERLSNVDLDAAIAEGETARTAFRSGRFGLADELLSAARRAGHPGLAEIEDWVGRTQAWRESYPDSTEPPPLPPIFGRLGA